MVKYSFRVHTATTRVPAAMKKASNPEPLLVKKLGAGQASYARWLSCSPWHRALVPSSHPPVQLLSLERPGGGRGRCYSRGVQTQPGMEGEARSWPSLHGGYHDTRHAGREVKVAQGSCRAPVPGHA